MVVALHLDRQTRVRIDEFGDAEEAAATVADLVVELGFGKTGRDEIEAQLRLRGDIDPSRT